MFRRQMLQQSRNLSRRVTSPSIAQRSSLTLSSSIQHPFIQETSTLFTKTNRRWQSTEAPTDSKAAEGDVKAAEPSVEEALKQELEKKSREVVDLKDKYLRSVADFRNLQERTKRDMDSARQFAIQRFAADLLDSIDNLDRAMGAVPPSALGLSENDNGPSTTTSNTSSTDPNAAASSESVAEPNKDLQNLHSGLRMTESIMMNTLKKHGLERFDPMEGEGRRFDPNRDEATFFTKVEGKQDGDVFFTQSKGFTLNGRVIRAAKVGVVKNT